MRFRALVFLAAAGCLMAQNWQEWLNRGVQAFKNGRYQDAVQSFQKAVDLNPGEVNPRLYLATAYMQQYIPGADTPENTVLAQKAETEFRQVLAIDAANRVALASLASLALNQKKWDDARAWFRQVLTADPNNKEAYYSLGFIAWAEWYPAYGAARTRLGMRAETPGPIADPAARTELRSRWWTVLDEGIWNLNRALEIDPNYDDAMAYMNLLIRERADLRDTAQEYSQDIATADQWVQKALAAKREKAGVMPRTVAPPPPPPPPPPSGSEVARIRVGANVQDYKLVTRVEPVYPPLARQARIQGAVKLGAVIGKDGTVQNLEVISGHPLLVPAALEAVKQYVYQPTLLNGQPVEVVTQIQVNFVLSQ